MGRGTGENQQPAKHMLARRRGGTRTVNPVLDPVLDNKATQFLSQAWMNHFGKTVDPKPSELADWVDEYSEQISLCMPSINRPLAIDGVVYKLAAGAISVKSSDRSLPNQSPEPPVYMRTLLVAKKEAIAETSTASFVRRAYGNGLVSEPSKMTIKVYQVFSGSADAFDDNIINVCSTGTPKNSLAINPFATSYEKSQMFYPDCQWKPLDPQDSNNFITWPKAMKQIKHKLAVI